MQLRQRFVVLLTALLLFSACSMIPGMVSDAEYEFEEGMALFNSGQYRNAIPRFQRATELDPNFGRAYLYLGRSYVSLKSWRQALTPLRTAYRLSPEETKGEALDILVDAIFAAGLDAFSSGDFDASVGYFKELLGLQPTSATGRNEFVKALMAQGGSSFAKGDYSQAIAAYTEAVKLSPNSFEAVFGLAKSFFRNGEYSKALDAAQSAFKVEPGNREIQSFLQELRAR